MNGDSTETLLVIGSGVAVILLAVVIPILLRPLNRKVDRIEYKARAHVRQKLSGSKQATENTPTRVPHEGNSAAASASASSPTTAAPAPSATAAATPGVEARRRSPRQRAPQAAPATATSGSDSAAGEPRRQVSWATIGAAGVAIVALAVLIGARSSLLLLLIVLVAVGIGIYITRDLKRSKAPTKVQIAEPAIATATSPMSVAATEPETAPAIDAPAQTTQGSPSPGQMQLERVELGPDDTLLGSLGIDIVNDGVPVAGPAETGEEFVSAIVAMENITLMPDSFDAGEVILGGSASVTFTQHRLFGVVWDIKGANATTYSTDAGSGSVLAFSAARGAFTASQFGRMRAGFTGHATYESMTVHGASSLSGEPRLLFDLDEGAFNRTAHGGIRLVVEAFTEGLRMPDHDTVREQL